MTPRPRLGTVTRNGDTYDLVLERVVDRPIEKVWAAITTPARIADWFAGAEVELELRLGGFYRLRFEGFSSVMEGEIIEFDPPRRLAHTWPDDERPQSPAIVRYELTPEGEGCRIRLTNSGVVEALACSIAGWHVFLDAIPAAIDGVRTPWSEEAEAAVLELYRDQLPS